MIQRILTPVDFTRTDEDVPGYALSLAKLHQAELHVVELISEHTPISDDDDAPVSHFAPADPLASADDIPLVRTALQGEFAASVLEYAKNHRIDLVVFDQRSSGIVLDDEFRATVIDLTEGLTCSLLVTPPSVVATDTSPEPIDFTPVPSHAPHADDSAALELLRRAIASRASDLHIDPATADTSIVRLRLDGQIHDYCTLHRNVASVVRKQLKVMANVSLADPFHPTESRLELPETLSSHEVRMTTMPVARGEAMALRFIDRDKLYHPLEELGLSTVSFSAIRRMLHQRSGLVLVAGPAGAGKTTTAYSMLRSLVAEHQNIVSIEDPVELLVPFMRQISVDKRHHLTMDVALATILRMDPDVVFVGEIRDPESAHVAMQAAGCGKRAFSTIHMRDCSTAVAALRKLDIDAKTVAENVAGVVTQRLVRRLCQSCAEPCAPTDQEEALFETRGIDIPAYVMRPQGCDDCHHTGYRGRVGVFEAVVLDGAVTEGIRQNAGESELRRQIRDTGTPDLVTDGLAKVCNGRTTTDEILAMNWLPESVPARRPANLLPADYPLLTPAPTVPVPSTE